jgi:hypothetical protein
MRRGPVFLGMLSPQPETTQRRNRIPDGPTQARFSDSERAMLRAPPTFYDPAFAHLVIETMSDGYSFGGIAGKIGVSRRTIDSWRQRYPEFEEACSRAMAVRQRWWEERLIHVALTGGIGSQGTVAMFGVCNAGPNDWKMKQEIEHTGQLTLAALVESSMKAIEARTIEGIAIEEPNEAEFFD